MQDAAQTEISRSQRFALEPVLLVFLVVGGVGFLSFRNPVTSPKQQEQNLPNLLPMDVERQPADLKLPEIAPFDPPVAPALRGDPSAIEHKAPEYQKLEVGKILPAKPFHAPRTLELGLADAQSPMVWADARKAGAPLADTPVAPGPASIPVTEPAIASQPIAPEATQPVALETAPVALAVASIPVTEPAIASQPIAPVAIQPVVLETAPVALAVASIPVTRPAIASQPTTPEATQPVVLDAAPAALAVASIPATEPTKVSQPITPKTAIPIIRRGEQRLGAMQAGNENSVTRSAQTTAARKLVPVAPNGVKHENRISDKLAEFSVKTQVNGVAMGKVSFRVDENNRMSISLKDIILLLKPKMDDSTFNRLNSSSNSDAYVTFDTVRAAGIDVRYDAIRDQLILGTG